MRTHNPFHFVPLRVAQAHGHKLAMLWAAAARYVPQGSDVAWPKTARLAEDLDLSERAVKARVSRARQTGAFTIDSGGGAHTAAWELLYGGHKYVAGNGTFKRGNWLRIPDALWEADLSEAATLLVAYADSLSTPAYWSTIADKLGLSKGALCRARNEAKNRDILHWEGSPPTFTVTLPPKQDESRESRPHETATERAGEESDAPPGKERGAKSTESTATEPKSPAPEGAGEGIKRPPSEGEKTDGTGEGSDGAGEGSDEGHVVLGPDVLPGTVPATARAGKENDPRRSGHDPTGTAELMMKKKKEVKQHTSDQQQQALKGVIVSDLEDVFEHDHWLFWWCVMKTTHHRALGKLARVLANMNDPVNSMRALYRKKCLEPTAERLKARARRGEEKLEDLADRLADIIDDLPDEHAERYRDSDDLRGLWQHIMREVIDKKRLGGASSATDPAFNGDLPLRTTLNCPLDREAIREQIREDVGLRGTDYEPDFGGMKEKLEGVKP